MSAEALFEAVKEGFSAGMDAYFAGVEMVLDAAYSDGVQHFAAHGAHELAAAMNNGSGFVMYPRTGHDDGPEIQAAETPQMEGPQIEAPQMEMENDMGRGR